MRFEMAYVNSSRAFRATLSDRLSSLVAQVREANARRALYSRTLRELNALSDRDLTDLGMSRFSIADVARRAAYGH